MKKRFLALALGTLAFGVTLGGVKMGLSHHDAMMVKAAGEQPSEAVYKTLSFPDDNKENNGVGSYTSKWTAKMGEDTYTVQNFNNNSWGNNWTYIKCGNGSKESVASITSNQAFASAVTKVRITIDNIVAKNVKSINLIVSPDSTFKNPTSTIEFTKAQGVQSVSLETALANQYYKIEFNCNKGGKSVQLSKIEFLTAAGEIAPVGSISLKADSAFKQEQFKGNSFDFSGLSVSANRTDNSSYSLKLDQVQWFVKGSTPESAEVALLDENGLIANSLTAGSYTLVAKYNEFASKENIALTIKDKVLTTAVEIMVESESIQVGETTAATAVVSPDDTTLKDVTWHAEDDTIVSVDAEGNVEGLKVGTTKIYAVTKDGSNVESNRVEITVTGYEAKTYHQITAEQVDYSGTYILGYHKQGNANAVAWCCENTRDNSPVAFDNGSVTGTKVADQRLIVLDKVFDDKNVSQGYSIRIIGGANDGKFIAHDSAKGMTFDTKAVTYRVAASTKEPGSVVIENSVESTLRYNAQDNLFRFYATGQQPVQLYRLDYTADVAVNAKAFADKFVAAPICGTDDNTPANADEFEKFVTEYSGLSRDVRAYLANGDGRGEASFDAFYAKYNAIMDKRASNTEFYDFLAGKYRPAKTQGVFGINQNITDSTTWSLVGIGAVTIAASASLLFFRRKKSN